MLTIDKGATQAQIYRTFIELENEGTPEQIDTLWADRQHYPPALQELLAKIMSSMQLGSPSIRRYRKDSICSNVIRYRGMRTSSSRRLLLCVCGFSNRMYMPTPAFLQYFDDGQFDVVMIKDPSRRHYLLGVPEYTTTLEECVQRLRQDLSIDRYADFIVLGNSAGGAAALYLGLRLGASRAVCLGGRHPAESDRFRDGSSAAQDAMNFQTAAIQAQATRTKLICAFGEHYPTDEQGALELRRRLPQVRLVRIRGLDRHSIFQYLIESGKLSDFLKRIVVPNT